MEHLGLGGLAVGDGVVEGAVLELDMLRQRSLRTSNITTRTPTSVNG